MTLAAMAHDTQMKNITLAAMGHVSEFNRLNSVIARLKRYFSEPTVLIVFPRNNMAWIETAKAVSFSIICSSQLEVNIHSLIDKIILSFRI